MKKKYYLKNLDCANCAAKIESTLKNLDYVNYASIDFSSTTLMIDTNDINQVEKVIKSMEPDVFLVKDNTKKKNLTKSGSYYTYVFAYSPLSVL